MAQGHAIRQGTPEDITAITALILEHGPNQWNYLPEDEVQQHVGGIAVGKTFAVVAELDDTVIGAVTYTVNHDHAEYQPAGREVESQGYLAEAVVHSAYVGKGIGTTLFEAAIKALQSNGIAEIYAMRHADNVPSGRMMEKNGMIIIDEFDDPERRPLGSRRTTVTRIIV